MSRKVVKATDFFSGRSSPSVLPIPNLNMNKSVSSRYVRPVSGDVGIEIEIEGEGLPGETALEKVVSNGYKWRVDRDGSLRGGLEYILAKPTPIKEVPTLVEGLYKTFEQGRSTIYLSNRCSTHVHVNASMLKVNEITSIIAVFGALEEALINIFGETRKNNHFCLPMVEAENTLQAWDFFLQSGHIPESDSNKYSSLNISTLWRYGSLEFRCAPAFENSDDVVEWAKFLLGLRDYCVERFQNPLNLGNRFSEDGPVFLVEDVCKASGTEAFGQKLIMGNGGVEEFSSRAVRGLRNLQKIIYKYPWDVWLTEYINKEIVKDPFEVPVKAHDPTARAAVRPRQHGEIFLGRWAAQWQDLAATDPRNAQNRAVPADPMRVNRIDPWPRDRVPPPRPEGGADPELAEMMNEIWEGDDDEI